MSDDYDDCDDCYDDGCNDDCGNCICPLTREECTRCWKILLRDMAYIAAWAVVVLVLLRFTERIGPRREPDPAELGITQKADIHYYGPEEYKKLADRGYFDKAPEPEATKSDTDTETDEPWPGFEKESELEDAQWTNSREKLQQFMQDLIQERDDSRMYQIQIYDAIVQLQHMIAGAYNTIPVKAAQMYPRPGLCYWHAEPNRSKCPPDLCARMEGLNIEARFLSDRAKELEKEHQDYLMSIRGYQIHQLDSINFLLGSVSTDRYRVGMRTVANIRHDLLKMRYNGQYPRTELQKKMHDKLLASLLPHLFGEEWVISSHSILKTLGLKYTNRFMLFACTRRMGKTEGIAMFLATALYRMPFYTRIAVFGRDALVASLLLEAVRKYTLQLSSNETDWHRLNLHNHEVLKYSTRGRDDPLANVLICMPGTTGRGIGGHIVVCDEMGFMTRKLINETIAPLLQVASTQFVGISSHDADERNFFIQLLDARHPETNELLFDVTNLKRMCEECRLTEQVTCNHVEQADPPHIDAEANHAIYAMMNDRAQFLAELLGISSAQRMRLFDTRLIDGLRISEALAMSVKPFFVFSLLDVAGGGSQSKSKSAIVTVAYQRTGEYLVIGFDDIVENEAGHGKFIALCIDHIRRVHENSWFADSNHGIIIESNYGGWSVSQLIFRGIRDCHPTIFGIHIPTKKEVASQIPFCAQVSWHHSEDDARYSALLFGRLLHEHKVRIVQGLVTLKHDGRTELVRQLSDLENSDPTEKEEASKKQLSFTGKRSGVDDIAKMTIAGSLLTRLFLTDPRHQATFPGWSIYYFANDTTTDEARQDARNTAFNVVK